MQKPVLKHNAVFQEETDGGYSVWVPDLPGCASQGETFEQALSNIKEAIELYLEDDATDLQGRKNIRQSAAYSVGQDYLSDPQEDLYKEDSE